MKHIALILFCVSAFAQQVIQGDRVFTGTANYCADAGANDTYACTITGLTAYATGGSYRFKANTANTGAATINLSSIGAKSIVKVEGGVTTALSDNDIRAGQFVDLVYDGTNMQMQSTTGNAPAGGGGGVASIVGSYATITGTTCNASNDGQLGFPTIGGTIFDYLRCKNGTGWENILQGTVLPASDWSTGWTADNFGSATFTTSKGGAIIETVSTNDNIRGRYRTAPSTPYNAVIRFNFAGGDGHAGIYLSNGTNNNVYTFHWYAESDTINHRFRYVGYSNKTGTVSGSTSGTYLGNAISGRYADICVSDDGTNLKYQYSRNNGATWTSFYSISRTTMTAPTRWGVYALQGGGATQTATATFAAFKENSGTATCSW